ncbi:MAG: hypothetical protein GY833_22610 [Aestuariibacter sp.]|nr:hypothetical protein [Aestuariibacter sp.]|tara:strand:- start:238798 stop:239223 length:426 start_codon:yes stop_codon:yes gene_type:complete
MTTVRQKELGVLGGIAIFSLGMFLGHYLTQSAGEPASQPDITTLAPDRLSKAPPRTEVFLNDDGIECIRDTLTGALSCNFVKYEEAIKACEEEQLAKNTFVGDGGKEITFPLLEGECEAKVKIEAVEAHRLAEERARIVWH